MHDIVVPDTATDVSACTSLFATDVEFSISEEGFRDWASGAGRDIEPRENVEVFRARQVSNRLGEDSLVQIGQAFVSQEWKDDSGYTIVFDLDKHRVYGRFRSK